MTEWLFASSLGFVSGGALIWFCKARIQELVIGANALSARLHAQVDALTAVIKKV